MTTETTAARYIGYSITMRPESLARYAFPTGAAWTSVGEVA